MPGAPPAPVGSPTHAKERFAQIVANGTRLRLGVVRAWVKAEGGPVYNPLNIGPGRNYGTYIKAAAATVQLINTSSYYAGIRRAAATGDGDAQIAAIKASPWDAGHYSNGVLDRTWAEEKGKGVGLDDIPIIGGPLDAVKDGTMAVAQFVGALLNPQTWVRVVQVLGGGILMILGLNVLLKDSPIGKAAIGAATTVATRGAK